MPECSSPLRAPQCGQNKPCREGRRGPLCDPLSHSIHALTCYLVILSIEFHADVPAACHQRCRAGTAAACEGIEYEFPWKSEAANQ